MERASKRGRERGGEPSEKQVGGGGKPASLVGVTTVKQGSASSMKIFIKQRGSMVSSLGMMSYSMRTPQSGSISKSTSCTHTEQTHNHTVN